MRHVPVTLALVLTLLVALLAAGCGGSEASKEDFGSAMVSARNDTDAGLAQIVLADSWEDLLERMKVAAVEVRGAAADVRTADAPEELEDERDLLAERLVALSDEIISTVETFESFPDGTVDLGAELRAVEHRAGVAREPAPRGHQGQGARAAQARDPAPVGALR